MRQEKTVARKSHGYCKLTHRTGRFVDSHIIPESLTRPTIKSNPLFQYGSGIRPLRRWSSWYEPRLVTDEGERYLSDLDNWAVLELRKHRLVWSGWGDELTLDGHHTKIHDGIIGVRRVDGIDPIKLRLFFLSLLWRAAATQLKEFLDVVLPLDDVEKLRLMILNNDTEPLSFYSCQLTQLSTKGITHNHAPLRDTKYLPDLERSGNESIELQTFRFYFDGLIAHMHVGLPLSYNIKQLGNLIVGAENSLVLSTVTFEGSLQNINMRAIMKEYGI